MKRLEAIQSDLVIGDIDCTKENSDFLEQIATSVKGLKRNELTKDKKIEMKLSDRTIVKINPPTSSREVDTRTQEQIEYRTRINESWESMKRWTRIGNARIKTGKRNRSSINDGAPIPTMTPQDFIKSCIV